jgi:hypothetical protein
MPRALFVLALLILLVSGTIASRVIVRDFSRPRR